MDPSVNGLLTDAADAPADWSGSEAERLYHMAAWSDDYFFVNEQGHVAVVPERDRAAAIDIMEVVAHVRDEEDVRLPVLIRFQDVLHGRVKQLNEAFAAAIDEAGYGGRYQAVYPIKVNQLNEVVEEVLAAGRPYDMGLECGSKAELVAALAHLEDDATPLICNGYKDADILRLVLTGQQLGKNVIPVMEKYREFERLMQLAADRDVPPRFGVRVHLTTRGAGKWAASSGDTSKFGVMIPELLQIVERLEREEQQDALVLLHFHLGSQIADIQTLRQAVREVTRIYAQLRERGLGVQYIDVGGGLGVNYGAGYGGGHEDGINYTLEEYANSVVYSVLEVCDEADVPHPTIISESGRALTAHHSVLVVDVLGAYGKRSLAEAIEPEETDHAIVHDLADVLLRVREAAPDATTPRRVPPALMEAYHDVLELRQQAQSLFSLGYLPIEQFGRAEQLFWAVCYGIQAQAAAYDRQPVELQELAEQLTSQYLCDFSVFQSVLDHWAIGQRFPVMPLHRLDEYPSQRAVLVDLTCDSDGKVNDFIDPEDEKHALEVHPLRDDESYLLGFFMMGAYQDIMGDMHNLFGRLTEIHVYADADEPDGFYVEKLIPGATVEEMLGQVQYSAHDLHRRMRALVQEKIQAGVLRPRAGMEMLQNYERTFRMHTYLSSE